MLAGDGVEAVEWDLFVYVVDGVEDDCLAWINLQYYLISYNNVSRANMDPKNLTRHFLFQLSVLVMFKPFLRQWQQITMGIGWMTYLSMLWMVWGMTIYVVDANRIKEGGMWS